VHRFPGNKPKDKLSPVPTPARNSNLKEAAFHNIIGFALKGPPKWFFGGILGAMAKVFGGNPPQ